MKKKITSLLVTTAVCASLTGTSFATPTGNVDVLVNGESLHMLVPPVIQQGRALVPVREISEALGYTVSWDRDTQTVYLNNQNEVTNKYNSSNERIIINGNPIASEIPPQVINGRTMVPIRAISEATGANVQWDQQNRRVIVDTSGSTISFPEELAVNFETAILEKVDQIKTIPSDWEKKGSIELGQVDRSDIVLDLYEHDLHSIPSINGVFTYKNQQYFLYDLNWGTINEIENQNLNLEIGSDNNQLQVVASIGVEYVSQLLVFNQTNQEWLVMFVPGEVVASESSGIYTQFPGKGLNPATAFLYRFQNDELVVADINKSFRSFVDSHNIPVEWITTKYQVTAGESHINVSLIKDGKEENQSYILDGNTLKLR
ncbi:copper amine oxidase N-terminal domain-containing protein [Bacillus horti]|uniref:Copper amine oxidase-like N-terminal domain-containing protein n=1 Tax=Caldalkalibacillus horti TaxID=77523 RepID=A0ABT9W137_9BACI|nr:copper amine oxidase N-terminal domain-containing protein [Bacillus horti]MDQ0166953.1 hypothetical protein [Bacillus horti]